MRYDPIPARLKRIDDGSVVIYRILCGRKSKPCSGLLGETPITKMDTPLTSSGGPHEFDARWRGKEFSDWRVEHPLGLWWEMDSGHYHVIRPSKGENGIPVRDRHYGVGHDRPRREAPDEFLISLYPEYQGMQEVYGGLEAQERWASKFRKENPFETRRIVGEFPTLPAVIVCPQPDCGRPNLVLPPDGPYWEPGEAAQRLADSQYDLPTADPEETRRIVELLEERLFRRDFEEE